MLVEKAEYRFDGVEEFSGFLPSLLFDAKMVEFPARAWKNTGNGGTNPCSPHKISGQHFHMIAVQDGNPVPAHAHDVENLRDIP
jgi:hypothetical protein